MIVLTGRIASVFLLRHCNCFDYYHFIPQAKQSFYKDDDCTSKCTCRGGIVTCAMSLCGSGERCGLDDKGRRACIPLGMNKSLEQNWTCHKMRFLTQVEGFAQPGPTHITRHSTAGRLISWDHVRITWPGHIDWVPRIQDGSPSKPPMNIEDQIHASPISATSQYSYITTQFVLIKIISR